MSKTLSFSAPSTDAPAGLVSLLGAWNWIERLLAIVTFSAIGLLMMYDVITRELLTPLLAQFGINGGSLVLIGSQKIGVYFLIAGAFTGFSLATATGGQLVPKIGFKWVPKSWDSGMNRMGDLVSSLFLVIVTYYAVAFVRSSADAGLMTTSGIETKVWILQAVIPIGFASAAARYMVFAIWPAVRPTPPEFQE